MIVDTTAIIIDLVNLCHKRHRKRAMFIFLYFRFLVVTPNDGCSVRIFWIVSRRMVMAVAIAFVTIITVGARLQVAEPALVAVLEESLHQMLALAIKQAFLVRQPLRVAVRQLLL